MSVIPPSASGWTPKAYSAIRFVLGIYLAIHFVMLTPWAPELFSREGVIANGAASPILRAFPNLLALNDSPTLVSSLCVAATAASVLLAVGLWDRWAALFIWYVLACFLGRNPLILNPSLPHIGWLLLMHAAVPRAPAGSFDAWISPERSKRWFLPRPLFAANWVVMSAAYGYSGMTKLTSPSWIDGNALRYVLENPLSPLTPLRDLALALPSFVLTGATWFSLGLEVLFPLLACHSKTRPWAWLAMVGMHLGLLAFVDFHELSVGMLILHAWTFEPRWVDRWLRGSDSHQNPTSAAPAP